LQNSAQSDHTDGERAVLPDCNLDRGEEREKEHGDGGQNYLDSAFLQKEEEKSVLIATPAAERKRGGGVTSL
jgi:hypothetical protein